MSAPESSKPPWQEKLPQRAHNQLPGDPVIGEKNRGKWLGGFARILLAANLLLALAGWYISDKFANAPVASGLIGFCLSLVIFLLMESLASRERRASALAQAITLELQERERLLRGIIDSSHDGFIKINSAWAVVACNKATETILGWSERDILGTNFFDRLVSPPDREKYHKELGDLFSDSPNSMPKHNWQIEGRHRDGHAVPLELSVSVDEFGEDRCVNFVARDITARIRAREREVELVRFERDAQQAMTVYKSEKKFRALMESAPDATVIADEQGKIVLVNSRTEELFGYEAADLIGQPVEILVPARFRGVFIANPHARPVSQDLELYGKKKNGEEVPIEISLSPIITDEGTLVSSAIRDISRRKLLQEDNDRLAGIVRSSNSAIFSISLDGAIQNWNAGAEILFGYQAEEILAQPINRLTPPEHIRVWETYLQRFKQGGALPESETVGVRLNGSFVDISISASPMVDIHGNITSTSIVCRDLTERKRTERVTQKNVDLETLLYVTSHDLREPLRTIENFSRLVIDRYAGDLQNKGKDFLNRILRAATRMNRLLDDILALSRAERCDTPLDAVAGEVVVQEALKSLHEKIQDTGAKVTVAQGLPQFRVNPMWATQAVYNLVANALKFSRSGEPPQIDISAYAVGGDVGLVVKDRGPGVEDRHAQRIFDLFQRAVGREVEGTGAGLAIVKQVAARHGGRAWVGPRDGGGSEFYITFGKATRHEAKNAAENWACKGDNL